MKRHNLYILALAMLFSFQTKAQRFKVDDADFMDYLKTTLSVPFYGPSQDSIDAKDLGQFTYLKITPTSGSYIENIHGIEAFTSLGTLELNCYINRIGALPSSIKSLATPLGAHIIQLGNLPNLDSVQINLVDSLMAISHNLVYLKCDSTKYIESFPNKIYHLDLIDCYPKDIPDLPDTVVNLLLPQGNCYFRNSFATWPIDLEYLGWLGIPYKTVPSFPETLLGLGLEDGLIEELPPFPQKMTDIWVKNNKLRCLPILPPKLKSLEFAGNQILCVPNYVPVDTSVPVLITMPLCTETSGCNIGYNLVGRVFKDTNADCTYQKGEAMLNSVLVVLSDSNGNYLRSTYTNTKGEYAFTASVGKYIVTIDTTDFPFTIPCNMLPHVISSIDTADSTGDIGVTCPSGFDIGTVAIYNDVRPRPGGTVELNIEAGDMRRLYFTTPCGSATGNVTLSMTNNAKYDGILTDALTPTSVNATKDTIQWSNINFATSNPFTDFGIKIYIDTLAQSKDLIYITVNISPTSGDIDTTNNAFTQLIGIVNSYDPNNKEVSPPDTFTVKENWLTYTIHFQNTGNAEAINVRIQDTLDANLIPSTLHVTATSHEASTHIERNGLASFNFKNIKLADSTSNEKASHGFVQYKVKRKDNISLGTNIHNTAYIYFDYNSPIITDIATTLLGERKKHVGIVENRDFNIDQIIIYPNPSSDIIHVSLKEVTNIAKIELIDFCGKTSVIHGLYNQRSLDLPKGDHASGVYLLKVTDLNGKLRVGKFIWY
jgi:uncharacterized repeat protein (TIGR01451 family)